jgi:hypothetical protein
MSGVTAGVKSGLIGGGGGGGGAPVGTGTGIDEFGNEVSTMPDPEWKSYYK